MHFPHLLFRRAGLNSTDIANLFGVSRVTGYRWGLGKNRNGERGVGVNVFLQDKVAKTAAIVQRAVDADALPDPDLKKLSPGKRATKIRSILNQHRMKR